MSVQITRCKRCGGNMLFADEYGDVYCHLCGRVEYQSYTLEQPPTCITLAHDYRRVRCEVESRRRIFNDIHRMKRKKEYREEVKRLRYLMNFPLEGYGRRKAKRKLMPLIQAYLDNMHSIRGSYKRKREAVLWLAIIRTIRQFAEDHPLSKRPRYPMPIEMAFDEVVYREHNKYAFSLSGHYFEGGNPSVMMEDMITPATQGIARIIISRLKKCNSNVTDLNLRILDYQIRIFKRESGWWRWGIRDIE